MYEQLIEALREEASVITERFRSPIGGTDAKLIDIADALANVAHRLEGAESPLDLSTVTLHPSCEYITNPTEPPTIPSLSPDDRLDIRCRASHTTSAPPDDDDEPLTAEWLESAQPAFLAADADYIIALYRTPACGRVTMAISGSAATLEYVTTRGDYRTLRRMLGVPMEDA